MTTEPRAKLEAIRGDIAAQPDIGAIVIAANATCAFLKKQIDR